MSSETEASERNTLDNGSSTSKTLTPEESFQIEQFNALRREIIEIRRVVMRLMIGGIFGLPVIIGLGAGGNPGANETASAADFGTSVFNATLLMLSPLIVWIVALLVLYQTNCLMRAGRYIREYTERYFVQAKPPFHNNSMMMGWETFLESESGNRLAERYLMYAIQGIFAIYYLLGAAMALWQVPSYFPVGLEFYVQQGEEATELLGLSQIFGVLCSIYLIGGLALLITIRRSFIVSTRSPSGRMDER